MSSGRGWRLPGTDGPRNIVLCAMSFLLFLGVADAPEEAAGWIFNLTKVLSLVSSGCGLGTLYLSSIVDEPENVSRVRSFFIPKLVAMIGAITFMLSLCLWVVGLGGVLQSPFASFLTVTPVFYIAVWLTQNDREAYLATVMEWALAQGLDEVPRWRGYLRFVYILQAVPLVIVLLTITVIELLLTGWLSRTWYLGSTESLSRIAASTWFLRVSYVAFYLGIVFTVVIVVPPEQRQAIRRRLF